MLSLRSVLVARALALLTAIRRPFELKAYCTAPELKKSISNLPTIELLKHNSKEYSGIGMTVTHTRLVREFVKFQMKSSSRKRTDWITSSFGGIVSSKTAKQSNLKHYPTNPNSEITKSSAETVVSNAATTQLTWVEKYKPTKEGELAINKTKILEVKQWMVKRLDRQVQKGIGKILVLTGPAGAGKTATIDVLGKELDIEVQEWNTPVSLSNEEYQSWKDFQSLSYDSQKKQFHDFLLRANRYPTLSLNKNERYSSKQGQKVILVEDIPNIFQRNVRDFHGTLSFNSIAMTNLTKALSKIIQEENKHSSTTFSMPSKDTLDLIATNSAGDIRACINSLQFFCTNERVSSDKSRITSTKPLKSSKKSKSTKVKEVDKEKDARSAVLCSKDTSLLLFRSLGKILYCKRELTPLANEARQLPKHLQDKMRNKLLFDPEAVIEKTHVASDNLNLYLHQNYLLFQKDIDDLVIASSYLSDADFMTGLWSSRDIMKDYSCSLTARGLIFANHGKASSSSNQRGWRPLNKPKWFEIFKETNSNKRACDELFHDLRFPAVELCLDVLPYLSKINVCLRTPSHISFVQMMSHYSVTTLQSSSSLGQDENYIGDTASLDLPSSTCFNTNKTDEQPITLSQLSTGIQGNNEEEVDAFEENLIEDFSDEDDMFFM
eukprot:gene8271-9154_t